MSVRVLCIGDIHLGRRPSRLPEEVIDRVGAEALTPAATWRLAVEEAERLGVDAVVLAGDTVEQNDDFYEAYGDLKAGIERLAAAGVPVLGVAGNHDVEVLPRLADAIPRFRLLGHNGTWEEAMVAGRDGAEVRFVGWSFPQPVVSTSPLAGGLPPRDQRPTVGLLHCDRDQAGSRYAPVRSGELEAAPVDAWLLGHIHRPDPLHERAMGYLGSLVGLDPSESGPHGPWLLDVGQDRAIALQQLPLAPLRWEPLEVRVDDLPDPDSIHVRIVQAIESLHDRLAGETHRPQVVGCRIRLVGRTAYRQALQRLLDAADPSELLWTHDGIAYFVNRWTLEALPALDLEEVAQGTDPAGLLARKLLVLRADPEDPARQTLLAEANERLAEVVSRPVFAALRREVLDEQKMAEVLEASALRALDELLAQREAGP